MLSDFWTDTCTVKVDAQAHGMGTLTAGKGGVGRNAVGATPLPHKKHNNKEK